LVRDPDFERAQSILVGLGFAPVEEAGNYHRAFDRQGTLVELHVAVGPPSSPQFDLCGAWARAVDTTFRGQPTRMFANTDLILYLVLHGVKHHFARLIWVVDIVRALKSIDEDGFTQVHNMARTVGVEGALLTTCELARRTLNLELPASAIAAIALKPAIPAQASAICETMLAGPANPETIAQGAGLFIQLEPDRRRRWAQRFRLFVPSQQDYLWAERYGISPFATRFLRPLRLLFRHGLIVAFRALFPPRR